MSLAENIEGLSPSSPSLLIAPRGTLAHTEPMTGTAQPALPFGGAAFVKDQEAAQYLGLSVRSVRYLVTDGKLRRVYPRERSARITVESLLATGKPSRRGKHPESGPSRGIRIPPRPRQRRRRRPGCCRAGGWGVDEVSYYPLPVAPL